jgi:hypothetical protein
MCIYIYELNHWNTANIFFGRNKSMSRSPFRIPVFLRTSKNNPQFQPVGRTEIATAPSLCSTTEWCPEVGADIHWIQIEVSWHLGLYGKWHINEHYWLVVEPPLWKIYMSSSVRIMTFPTWWESHKIPYITIYFHILTIYLWLTVIKSHGSKPPSSISSKNVKRHVM